jgi:predicted Rdx family selenoprotein
VAELSGTEHTAEMAPGESGQFDVLADDRLVFSKHREGRYPELHEILAALAQ